MKMKKEFDYGIDRCDLCKDTTRVVELFAQAEQFGCTLMDSISLRVCKKCLKKALRGFAEKSTKLTPL